MRTGWIVVPKRLEETTGDAHASYRDPALLLKRSDHRDQGTQEGGLLGGGKLTDRLQQEVGPRSGGGRLAAASRGEDGDDTPAITRCPSLATRPSRCRAATPVRGGSSTDAELFCQGPEAQSVRIGRSSASTCPCVGVRPRPPASAQACCLRAMPILASPIVTRSLSGSSGGSSFAAISRFY